MPKFFCSITRHTSRPEDKYLILEPGDAATAFTVELAEGTYGVEWFGLERRETRQGERSVVESGGEVDFTAPFAGPAVLYLKRLGGEG